MLKIYQECLKKKCIWYIEFNDLQGFIYIYIYIYMPELITFFILNKLVKNI
jgi:hypothetical protein